mgnify:FL=1
MKPASEKNRQPNNSSRWQAWGRACARLGLTACIIFAGHDVNAVGAGTLPEGTEVEIDWVVEAEDSVCGVVEARQIRKPGKVDFDRLVDLTPEGKRVRRDRIDPNSAEGVRLLNRAKSRVRDASAVIMKRQGYDSVWKRISSKKGAYIADLTAYVEIEIKKAPLYSAPQGS